MKKGPRRARRTSIAADAAASIVAAAVLALALALAHAACGGGGDRSRGGGHDAVSTTLPIRLLLDAVDGGVIDLASYRGRVVVLHLFDTDSPAAALDAEQLAELARQMRQQVTIIGVCLDREGYPMAAAWRRALGVRYLIALADPGLRDGKSPLGPLRVNPTTFLLDRSGRIARRIERPLKPGEIERLVRELGG